MSAALALDWEADHEAERDRSILAAARAADLALADKIAAEYVGPEFGYSGNDVGPTERWRQLRADTVAWRARRHRLHVASPLSGLDDVDEIAVERLAAGDLDPRRATTAERALAVARCRHSGLSIAQTADRLGMRPRSVERLLRRARATYDLTSPASPTAV